jgi:hypothetical protein
VGAGRGREREREKEKEDPGKTQENSHLKATNNKNNPTVTLILNFSAFGIVRE